MATWAQHNEVNCSSPAVGGVAWNRKSDSHVMTSDSNSKNSSMALIESHVETPYRPPLVAIGGGQVVRQVNLLPPAAPPRKTYDERTRLLSSAPSPSLSSATPETTTASHPCPTDHDRVHPWSYQTTNTSYQATSRDENMNAASTHSTTNTMSGGVSKSMPVVGDQPHAMFTKLLKKAHSMTTGGTSGHANIPKDQRRRHSILRVSTSKDPAAKTLKKSSSVEFTLFHEEHGKQLATQDQRATTSNTTPRRLTYEEKEDLYRIRPDLEVGPTPYYKEQLAELEQQNQRRMVFAIVGGMMCLMFLMVVYYILTIA